MSKEKITYANLTCPPGAKVSGWTEIPGARAIPVTLINGAKEGKTLLVTAGIHGGEYPGILTATRLAAEINPEEVSGQIVIINCVNLRAFYARVSYISPLDGKNLNRLFPGDADGTPGDKIARFLTENYQKRADFYLDLHGGDIHEELPPYVYCPGEGPEEAVKKAAEGAKLINADFLITSHSLTGAYNSRTVLGIPALLVERGCGGRWSEEEVTRYKKDVLNIAAWLGIIPGEVSAPKNPAKVLTQTKTVYADGDGMLFVPVGIKQEIKKGERLAYLTDIFGNTVSEYFAEFDGVVVYRATSLSISTGAVVITYGR